MTRAPILVAALLSFAALPVSSQEANEVNVVAFDVLDAKRTGKVQLDMWGEAEKRVENLPEFATVDKDGDGALTETEWNAYLAKKPSPPPVLKRQM